MPRFVLPHKGSWWPSGTVFPPPHAPVISDHRRPSSHQSSVRAARVRPERHSRTSIATLRIAIARYLLARDASVKDFGVEPGLPEPWLRARPKRLRFGIFCSPAKLVHHARPLLLRVHRVKEQLAEWIEVWRLMPART